AELSLSKMRNDLSNLQIRNGLYVIKAPQDGYILKANRQGLGETIKEGEEIFTIMPNVSRLAVELYVKPMDMPLLYVGCPMRIQFDGWPALVFSGWPDISVGTFGGKVAAIDKVSSQYNKFRVLVVPDENDHKWPDLLHVGAGASGWAMLNNVMVWYEVWRQFNGFPPDYTQDLPSKLNYYNGKEKKAKTSDDTEKE
ncbi:MAG: HlyD family secretion protein, partial [Cytophagales bacterium]|nr:HlyD family secretion protein [Cytophagales bacterium]